MKAKVLLLVIGIAATMLSCKKEDVKQKENIESEISSGSWKISYFNDSGTNETANFTGFTFSFNSDGKLVATNGTTTYTGTWSVTDSNSNDDSPNDLHFNIFFNLSNEFEDLNDDWDIVSHTSTKLELIDVSGGGGGTDELTFVRI